MPATDQNPVYMAVVIAILGFTIGFTKGGFGGLGRCSHPFCHWCCQWRWPLERDLEVIHSNLNDSDFARRWAEGQSMTVDEAVALALEE